MSTVGNLVDFGLDPDSTPSSAGGSGSNYLADGDTTANVVDENLKKSLEAGAIGQGCPMPIPLSKTPSKDSTLVKFENCHHW